MEDFREQIKLLHVHVIGHFLPEMDTRYLVKHFSETEFFIQREPAVYHGRLKDIYDMICYDYESLPISLQEQYRGEFETYNRIEDNLYQIQTKKYTDKNYR